ncbi:unnamed protein product [Musa textilis]
MASRIPGRKLGYEGSGGGGGGGNLFKRTLADMEKQLQNALLLRSVRQRTRTMPSIFSFSHGVGDLVCNSFTAAAPQRLASSLPSATSSEFGFPRNPELLLVSSVLEDRSPVSVSDQLRELERQLLLDDEDEAEASVSSSSAATHAEWDEAIQWLISPPPLLASPTNSSSSTVSFASCSPPSSMPSPPLPPSSRQMLLDTATALGQGNLDAATANLTLLKRAADTRGDAEQRLMAVMVTALLSRLNHPQVGISHPIADLRSPEHFAATQMLYSLSPCFKLGFVTANSAILDATKDEPKIHILDFEVGQGGQYAALIQTVAERLRLRPGKPPPTIRITAIIDPSSPFTNINAGNLRAVGDRIKKLAERFGVVLHFNIVSLRAAELDAASIGCETGEEALVVNLPFVLSRVPDESVSPENPRDELLRRVCALRPRLVAIAEQEINTSTAPFPARLAEACKHYGALLESLEAAAQGSSGPERGRVEAGLARRAVNAVAGEGAERVERCEVLGKWRARMSMAGFEPVPLGPTVVESIKARLASSWANPGFTVEADASSLALGFAWMNRVLTVASAWR